MDREADFLDLFRERRDQAPQVELLVRAKADRVLGPAMAPDGDPRRLFDTVRRGPACGTCTLEIRRLSARTNASKQAPPARCAGPN